MELVASDYVAIATIAVLIVLGVTPYAVRLAVSRGVVDVPGGHKSHESPVPYMGGLVMVLAVAVAIVLLPSLRRGAWVPDELLVIVGLAVVLAVMGFVDDIRGLSPWLRLAVEVGAAGAMYAADVRVNMFGPPALDLAVTIVWVVGIVNATNFLDNMDGLSAGVACIASISFFGIAVSNGQDLVAALALATAACALGFLRHNFHPARIYMGDAGSLFLGFILSVIGMKLRFDGPNQVTFFVPILVLGVPIFDTTLVTATRLIHGRSPLQGGRDHTSHRLVFIGLPVRVVVGVIYLTALSLGWLGAVMANIDRTPGAMLMALVVTLAVVAGVSLGAIPVYTTSRRRRMMLQEVAGHEIDARHVEPPPSRKSA